jgi:hypothetical protein
MTLTISENWSLRQLLFRPFDVLQMLTSLILGLVIMTLTACVCAFGDVHLDGVLDLHVGAPSNIGIALGESAIDLFCMVLCVFAAGFLLGGKEISVLNILSTQALARALFLPSSILVFLMSQNPGFNSLLSTFAGESVPEPPGSLDILICLFLIFVSLGLIVWTVILMYRAYTASCNIRGTKAVFSFIGVLITAEILSKYLVSVMLFV